MRETADEVEIREVANWAYACLSNMPEFGEETRWAIVDTAADRLYDDGYDFDYDLLLQIATELAG